MHCMLAAVHAYQQVLTTNAIVPCQSYMDHGMPLSCGRVEGQRFLARPGMQGPAGWALAASLSLSVQVINRCVCFV